MTYLCIVCDMTGPPDQIPGDSSSLIPAMCHHVALALA